MTTTVLPEPSIAIHVDATMGGVSTKKRGEHVFDRFWQADRARAGAGTGLGLPYCKLVADAHHGKIWAESEPGKGFAVSIALPLNPEEER